MLQILIGNNPLAELINMNVFSPATGETNFWQKNLKNDSKRLS